MKILRSDTGTEWNTCRALNDFLKEHRIKHEYSVIHTPQQNGVAERLNRTIEESVCSMLVDKMSTSYCPQTVKYAVLINNCLPTLQSTIKFHFIYAIN